MIDGYEVRDDQVLDEVEHGDVVVTVRRRLLGLPASGGGPPLAVEHSSAPGVGSGRPNVVLVHGLAQNKHTWRLSRRSFVAHLVRNGFDVWNVELRGHGDSRRLGARNATSIADYVHDATRVIAACPAPPFVIGHSLGGAVVLGAAARVPVAGVVHLAGVWTFATGNATLRALAAMSRRAAPMLTAAPVRMSTGWAGRVLGALYQVTDIAGYGFPIAGWTPGSLERDLLEERLAMGFDWESVEVWLEMSEAAASGQVLPAAAPFAAVDVPLLVLTGDHDPLVRPVDARRCFEASASSDRTLLVLDPFEHRVHWGHVDLILGTHAPDVVWRTITEWMSRRVR